jgi:hypothetical protein
VNYTLYTNASRQNTIVGMSYPELIIVKVTSEMASEIRQRAQADDRTLSGYVRRLLAHALRDQDVRR